MNHASWLDVMLVATIGVVAALYVVYALSPARAQRVMLSWLYKLVGPRVFAWLSPRPGGCDQCAGVRPKFTASSTQAGSKPNRFTSESKP